MERLSILIILLAILIITYQQALMNVITIETYLYPFWFASENMDINPVLIPND